MESRRAGDILIKCGVDVYSRIGAAVRAHRLLLGWTQERLGEESGLHPSFIGQIERGTKKVSLLTLARLAAALRCTAGALLDERPAAAKPSWSAKIDALLRDQSPDELELMYSTLRHMSQQFRRKKGTGRR